MYPNHIICVSIYPHLVGHRLFRCLARLNLRLPRAFVILQGIATRQFGLFVRAWDGFLWFGCILWSWNGIDRHKIFPSACVKWVPFALFTGVVAICEMSLSSQSVGSTIATEAANFAIPSSPGLCRARHPVGKPLAKFHAVLSQQGKRPQRKRAA